MMPTPTKTIIQALYTEQTCGDACWHAREDVCRCSCGGRNHGCLRDENGTQPARTRKLHGTAYQLVAVEARGTNECRAATMKPIRELERLVNDNAINAGLYEWHEIHGSHWGNDKAMPCYAKTASKSECERWPELSAWHGESWGPLTLWVKLDLVNLI